MTFSFLFEKRQNSFSWDPALVHSGQQNTQILKVKALKLECCLV